MTTFPAAYLDIADVKIVAVFIDAALERCGGAEGRRRLYAALERSASEDGAAGSVVALWQDDLGRTRYLASPEQQRFWQATRYEQLRAQVNGEITARRWPEEM
jgi:hypothetical protein